MPIEIKQLTGKIDFDSPNEVIEPGSVRSARNIEWFGNFPNLRPQVIQGNQRLINPLLPGTGVNLTIGRHYDAVKHRLFFFNYNSSGTHGIYIFYTLPGTFVRVVQNGVKTNGDVLGFTPTTRIHSIDILYSDVDGDLLTYVDSLGRPSKLNISHFLNGNYTSGSSLIQRTYLDLVKAQPIGTPYAVYENDATVTNNNLVNSLFNFSCAHIYDDSEVSCIGSGAKQPLPPYPFDPINNTPAKVCSRIALYLPTGDQNVTKIVIYGTQTKDGATTAPFIIDTLVKADLNIPNNTYYRYLFYNNGNYIAADPAYSVLDYDYVPQAANCQTLLNGNVLAYGGITEGYPFFTPNLNITTQNAQTPNWSLNGTLFFAATNGLFTSGQPQITVYLTGVGINDGIGNPTTLEKAPHSLVVNTNSNGVANGFAYFNTANAVSIPTLLASLLANANTAGWTTVSTSTNSFTVYYPAVNTVLKSSYLEIPQVNNSPYNSAVSAHLPACAYSYGIVYRDAAGRTNGVISNVTGNIKTQALVDGQIPQITFGMGGIIPPAWAVYYEIVRTDNLTYSKYFDWVTAGAYQGSANGSNTVYGYFDVSNISSYNTQISATEGVVSYSFSPGDRIKILGRYDSAGSFTALNLDYAIVGSPVLVTANGVQKAGQFVQIYYPTADINSEFQFVTTANDTNFQNYKILIYSYKAYLPTNQNVYYQVGQQYGIGNPGLNTAFHFGNTSDNQVTLSDGDVFYRQRNVPLISSYFINAGGFDQTSPYGTDWINPGGNAIPIVDNGIWKIVGGVQKVAGLLPTQYPTYAENDMTILNKSTTETLAVRLRGSQTIIDKTDANGQYSKYVKVVLPGNVVTTTQIVPLQTGMQASVPVTVTWDQTIQLPPQGKLWLVNSIVNEMLIGGYLLELDVIRTLAINVFDFSFSDIYAIKTNSDNKPNVINVDAKTIYYTTLFRFSEAYQASTNINNTCRFYPDNFDEFLRQYGSIQRMYAWGNRLRVFQERKVGEVGVYSQFVQTNTGEVNFVKNEAIITQNNIQYYEEDYGIGDQASALVSSGFQNYFPDPIRGAYIRVSLDGVKNISEEFNFQKFAGLNLPNYNNDYAYQFGGNASLLGCYNFKDNKDGEVLFVLQGGTSGTITIPGQTLAFNERKNAATGEYDINPDDIVCCENTLYSFYNGELWVHNNSTEFSTFFDTFYPPSIQFIFNQNISYKKNFGAIGYQSQANKVWAAVNMGDVMTSFVNPESGRQQISQIPAANFRNEEGSITAALKFDANSGTNAQYAVNNGDVLMGWWLSLTLTAPDNEFNFIYLPFLRIESLPKTP